MGPSGADKFRWRVRAGARPGERNSRRAVSRHGGLERTVAAHHARAGRGRFPRHRARPAAVRILRSPGQLHAAGPSRARQRRADPSEGLARRHCRPFLWRRRCDRARDAIPDRTRALVLVDAALGLTAAPSDAPRIIQPKWIREVLVSLTITNPVATKTLLESLIEKKERALPEFVAILQRPTTQRDTTPDIADWLYYFLGADRSAVSADRTAYARTRLPVAILWGDKDTVTPIDQATDLQTLLPQATLTPLPGLGHIPQIEDPALFNDALLKTLGKL